MTRPTPGSASAPSPFTGWDPLWTLPGTYHEGENGFGPGATPAAPAADPAPATTPEPVAAASGAAPADEFADLAQSLAGDPRAPVLDRLRGVAQKRDEFKAQAEALAPWQETIKAFQELGLTPEQVAAFKAEAAPDPAAPTTPAAAPETPADPAQEFAAFLSSKLGTAPTQEWWENLTEAEQIALESAFAADQFIQQQKAAQTAQQAETQKATLALELREAQEANPAFKLPALEGLLRVAQGQGLNTKLCAQQLGAALETIRQNAITEYAAGKQQDAAAPPPAGGGNSPAPAAAFQASKASAEQRQAAIQAVMQAASGAP